MSGPLCAVLHVALGAVLDISGWGKMDRDLCDPELTHYSVCLLDRQKKNMHATWGRSSQQRVCICSGMQSGQIAGICWDTPGILGMNHSLLFLLVLLPLYCSNLERAVYTWINVSTVLKLGSLLSFWWGLALTV